MTFLEEAREQSEQIKHTFLERLEQLFSDIEYWVKEEGLHTDRAEIDITEKIIGSYRAPTLSVLTPNQQKIADIIPTCAFVIVAEGLVKIRGELDQQHLAYLRPSEQTIYSVYTDNWYWVEYSRNNHAYIMTKTILLKLLSMVSDYEFSSKF